MVVSTRFRIWCPQQICGLIIRFLHGCIVCGERGPIVERPEEGLLCAEHDQPSLGLVSSHASSLGFGGVRVGGGGWRGMHRWMWSVPGGTPTCALDKSCGVFMPLMAHSEFEIS